MKQSEPIFVIFHFFFLKITDVIHKYVLRNLFSHTYTKKFVLFFFLKISKIFELKNGILKISSSYFYINIEKYMIREGHAQN